MRKAFIGFTGSLCSFFLPSSSSETAPCGVRSYGMGGTSIELSCGKSEICCVYSELCERTSLQRHILGSQSCNLNNASLFLAEYKH